MRAHFFKILNAFRSRNFRRHTKQIMLKLLHSFCYTHIMTVWYFTIVRWNECVPNQKNTKVRTFPPTAVSYLRLWNACHTVIICVYFLKVFHLNCHSIYFILPLLALVTHTITVLSNKIETLVLKRKNWAKKGSQVYPCFFSKYRCTMHTY